MNQKDFIELCHATVADCFEVLGMKSQEYSTDTDRLSNFKKAAADLGLDPLQMWAVYYKKHVDAQFSFVRRFCEAQADDIKNQTAADIIEGLNLSEPIEGRFLDAINYCFLGMALLVEKRKEG